VRRIAIIGSGGSGKSVLARQLGERLGLPVIHLDRYFWRPGWVETPLAEWRARQEQLVVADEWIVDGNHQPTLDIRLRRADTIILVDEPRRVCLWRAFRRSLIYRGRPRTDRAEGCDERLDRTFLRFIWTYPSAGLPAALSSIEQHAPNAALIRLRGRHAVRDFVAGLPAPGAAPGQMEAKPNGPTEAKAPSPMEANSDGLGDG